MRMKSILDIADLELRLCIVERDSLKGHSNDITDALIKEATVVARQADTLLTSQRSVNCLSGAKYLGLVTLYWFPSVNEVTRR